MPSLNSIVRYFDIASVASTGPTAARGAPAGPPVPTSAAAPSVAPAPGPPGPQAPWLPQWLALLAGVCVEPVFNTYRLKGVLEFAPTWNWLLFSVVVAVIVFPGIYRNAFDPQKPLFVQLCAIFASGLGWQGLLETAVKTVQQG